MGLIVFDVFAVKSAAGKATAAAERLSVLAGRVGAVQLPPMRAEDRVAVLAATSAAATAVRAPVARLRNVAGEMIVRSTLLMRDMQQSVSGGMGIPSFALGVWAGSEESLELVVSTLKKRYKAAGEALAAQVAKHHAIGRDGDRSTRVTKDDRARLRELREDERFWRRWSGKVDKLLLRLGKGGRVAGRMSRILGHPALGFGVDFIAVAFGSPMLNNVGSKAVAGGAYASGNLAWGAVPGGAIFALLDSVGMAFGPRGYSQVSVGNMNTVTAQSLGAFDQAIRTGDYSGLEQIHQASMEGHTTIVQTTGAYLGDLYTSGDIVGFHEESLAGQHGAGAQNMAVTGETVNAIVTKPGSAISDAWDYWGSKL